MTERFDYIRGLRYRVWARLLHRLNLHHTQAHPMDDGTTLHRCDWCGMTRKDVPECLTAKRMREARSK